MMAINLVNPEDKNNRKVIDLTQQQNQNSISPKIDYSKFREKQYEELGELWNDSLSLAKNFINILKETVILPFQDIQLPIIAAYAMMPSAMASVVPILYVQGERGSGKSTVAMLIAALHNVQILSAATTFAATRNYFNSIRWDFPEQCLYERNTCLLFDNVNKDTLTDDQLYTLFLNGYNRKTDKISISKGNGENIDFRVFGLKVLSSVHTLYAQSRFAEFSRRCMVIKCKSFERFTQLELDSIGIDKNYKIAQKLDLDGIDLSILHVKFKDFWIQEHNLNYYAELRKKLAGRKKSLHLPDIFDGTKWSISIDLIVAGVVLGIWSNYQEGIQVVAQYWEWHRDNVMYPIGAAYKILKDFVANELEAINNANTELGENQFEKEINPERLKKHMQWASAKGMLDINPTPSVIAEIMRDLGWILDKGIAGNICWVEALR